MIRSADWIDIAYLAMKEKWYLKDLILKLGIPDYRWIDGNAVVYSVSLHESNTLQVPHEFIFIIDNDRIARGGTCPTGSNNLPLEKYSE